MKLSAKLRLTGFIFCCMGVVAPVAMMYQLKLVAVDQIPFETWWAVGDGVMFLTPFIGAILFQRSTSLIKEGK